MKSLTNSTNGKAAFKKICEQKWSSQNKALDVLMKHVHTLRNTRPVLQVPQSW